MGGTENFFEAREVAERYADARPYLHPMVLGEVHKRTGDVDRALDVGCGTGMSTRALRDMAASAVGLDPSFEMLRFAHSSPGTRYVMGRGECLPFADATFQLVSVALAFHWLDRGRFLAESARVLSGGGWLVVYNTWFGGSMRENPEFSVWNAQTYLARYPIPPRFHRPLTDDQAAEADLTIAEEWPVEAEVPMSRELLTRYLASQSNVSAMVRSGRESIHEATGWLLDQLSGLFLDTEAHFPFGGSVTLLRRHPWKEPPRRPKATTPF